jgi:hypothetical protein
MAPAKAALMKKSLSLATVGMVLITGCGGSGGSVWSDTSQSLSVTHHDGFINHPNGDECTGESFQFDASTHVFKADRCDGGKALPSIDRVLIATELDALNAVLSDLDVGSEQECIADVGQTTAIITDRNDGAVSYVDEASMCNRTSALPLDGASAEALVAELHTLSLQ